MRPRQAKLYVKLAVYVKVIIGGEFQKCIFCSSLSFGDGAEYWLVLEAFVPFG
ncbi:hypothetical protein DPEC_G00077860 [Dallia pectoralis]|uniref:Uncharacterized protein n=1 Tax=Dallia pectoralis TaxID=75939 RepID=A0ACC2H4B6_DALPE|nr:hypothetical protein DPEC_G00077860 [Dallia pectoralis]